MCRGRSRHDRHADRGGAAAIASVAPKHVEKVRELFIDVVSDDEVRLLTDIYERIVARIDEIDGITLPG
ncbi:hypothetical protein ACFSSF_06055 [Dietzia aerolata]|uniref:hypothetical protein n=1 Tax=Dietzia aerolata TaxID=595984 RepID=UPI003634FE9B